MKNLKDFKKFAINNKAKSTILGGNIAPDPCSPDDCGGSTGGGGGHYTPPMYCCGGNPSSICGTQINYVKVYCRSNGLPEPVRIN